MPETQIADCRRPGCKARFRVVDKKNHSFCSRRCWLEAQDEMPEPAGPNSLNPTTNPTTKGKLNDR
jgi:hypothetical protein